MVRVYNTLTEQKEALPKPKNRPVRLFVCGPTVYDEPHIGNARTFMAFDIIVRFLRSRGVKIKYLQNITDIDDRIITRAKEEKTDWKTIKNRYEKIFKKNVKDLGITSVDVYARATDYIPEIVTQVKRLLKKGHAYKIDNDGYYFDLKTFPNYGRLAHRTTLQAEDAVTRIDASNKKRNKGDFALWKLSEPGEPGWKSELGFGRPGWHIEDTAITEHFFGPQYEIHGGAIDLKFPHHEAEIAQQESASGKTPFVELWMHSGFLLVGGEKMSKSKGNFITINALLETYPAEVFRMMVLSHHYRAPMDYTPALAEAARKNIYDFRKFIAQIEIAAKKSDGKKRGLAVAEYTHAFEEAMDDDLNTTKALSVLFNLMNEVNPNVWHIDKAYSKAVVSFVKHAFENFGLNLKPINIPRNIKALGQKRELFRRNKQFMQSDALRKKINELGYVIEDTPHGPFVWPKD